MRISIFGANGATGRLLVAQALAAGHDVVAVTRNPDAFPLVHGQLWVAEADVRDHEAVARAVDGTEVVLSALGVPFSRQPIDVYSAGIESIAAAMDKHGIRRVAVVTSSAVEPARHADGGFLLNAVMQPIITRTIGRSTYGDMCRMEDFLRASDLDWTVLRPGGLFDAPEVTDYELTEEHSDRVYTSRADLAAALLAQATSTSWIRRIVAVNTTVGTPTLWQLLRNEAVS